jgi:putative MATE family efflux protein
MTDLTRGNETRAIIAFALPMLLGNVFQQLYSTVDGVVVGRFVGKEALAAVGASFPVMFFMISLVMGVTMGAGIMLSQFYGAGDRERLRRTKDTAIVFLSVASVAVTAAGLAVSGPILRLVRVPEAVFPLARSYLRIMFAGMVFTFGYNTVGAILRALGDSRRPLYFLIAATVSNVVLDLVFVLAFGWGITGAAWATVISQALSFALGARHVQRSELLRVRPRLLVFDRGLMAGMLRIGLPAGLQHSLVSLAFVALNRIVNPFGTAAMAGFAAASRLDSFAGMPAMNLSMAVSTFVGQNLGAGKPERVRRGFLAAMLVGIAISLALTTVTIFFKRPLIALFNTDGEVVRIGAEYLLTVSLVYPVFASMFITGGVLRGAGDTFVNMLISVLALWGVRIPVAAVLSSRLGTRGIWMGIPAEWVFAFSVTFLYYLTGRWKRKVLARPEAGLARATLPAPARVASPRDAPCRARAPKP